MPPAVATYGVSEDSGEPIGLIGPQPTIDAIGIPHFEEPIACHPIVTLPRNNFEHCGTPFAHIDLGIMKAMVLE
jgi:hypothetical protein